jgi:hypothetical protein
MAHAIAHFFNWAAAEDGQHHIGWVGISVMSMTAFIFPLTMFIVLSNGASFGLIMAAMISLALVVITNLSALPTKYTIPFFFLAILMDVVISVLSLVIH